MWKLHAFGKRCLVVKLRLLTLTVVVATGSGCNGGDVAGADIDPVAVTSALTSGVACLSTVGSVEVLPDDYGSILDVVAVPTRVLTAVYDGSREEYWAKSGLVARAGEYFKIEVADEQKDSVTIGWAGSEGDEVEGRACGTSGWLALVGGYTVDEPKCVELHVTDGQDKTTIGVGVGLSC